jgi:hypothetical protein
VKNRSGTHKIAALAAPSTNRDEIKHRKEAIVKHGKVVMLVLYGEGFVDFTCTKYQKQSYTLMPHLDALQA